MLAANLDKFCGGHNQTFIDDIISPIEKIFNVDSQSSRAFRYLALDLNENDGKQLYLNLNYI